MSSAFKRLLQSALFLGGLAAFFFSLKYAGFDRLGVILPAVTGKGLLILAVYPFMCAWDVAGWRVLFPADVRGRVRFWTLYAARLAGEAVNNITPFVDVGGEFLKVTIAASSFGIPKRTALGTVVMARTALFFSEITFWLTGLVIAATLFSVPRPWSWALAAAFAAAGAAGAWIAFAQRRGFFSTSAGWLRRFEGSRALIERLHVPLQDADRDIASFYGARRGDFALSAALHFAGWAAGGLENFVVMRAIGFPVSAAQAVLLEALFQIVKSASFFIPGNLGAQEAGLALTVQWMGHHPSAGIALSLYKRFRQAVWTGVGFATWGAFKVLPAKSAPARYNPSS